MKICTLVYLVEGDSVWLGRHTRGPCEGKLNGPGGKLEPEDRGELYRCAVREVKKEAGVQLYTSELADCLRGVIHFYDHGSRLVFE